MNPQGEYKLLLVPVDEARKAEAGEVGTPAAGDWVFLRSREDWDVGPYEVVAEMAADENVADGAKGGRLWMRWILECAELGADQRERAERAEAALRNAMEGLEEALPYVPEFFRNKWDLDTYVTRAKNALAVTADEEGAGP